MDINHVFIEVIKDIDKRRLIINNLISVIENINNISYYYIIKGTKRKNPNIEIKNKYDVLLNSGVVILYSHWEGLIKFSGKQYLKFIKEKEFKRDDLINKGNKYFVDYYINTKKDDLSSVLQNIVDDSPIPIDLDMLNNIQNLDYKNLEKLYKILGFNFEEFLVFFQTNIESKTGLTKGVDFIKKLTNYEKSDKYLVKYIEANKSSLNGEKILRNMIEVNKGKKNKKSDSIGLTSLRHKIAHGVDVNISFDTFKALSEITMLLLDVYIDFFKNELTEKYK